MSSTAGVGMNPGGYAWDLSANIVYGVFQGFHKLKSNASATNDSCNFFLNVAQALGRNIPAPACQKMSSTIAVIDFWQLCANIPKTPAEFQKGLLDGLQHSFLTASTFVGTVGWFSDMGFEACAFIADKIGGTVSIFGVTAVYTLPSVASGLAGVGFFFWGVKAVKDFKEADCIEKQASASLVTCRCVCQVAASALYVGSVATATTGFAILIVGFGAAAAGFAVCDFLYREAYSEVFNPQEEASKA